jgi:transposase
MTQRRTELQARRLHAETMFLAGRSQSDIVREFRVSRTTASKWERRIRAGKGMQATPTTGRKRLLSLDRLREIWAAREKWKGEDFCRAVKDATGVHYDRDHCYRLLHELKETR